ncbi:MAG TPA: hypothetical protein VKC34_10885, partial [Blastocatellia bacterium]|nr:hypothetical protein [Blastocatellia bacterium]
MNTEKRYLWNSRNSELQGACLFTWRDVVTRDLQAIPERHWKRIVSATISEVQRWKVATLDESVKRFYELLVSSRPDSIPDNEEQFDHRHFCLLPSFNLSGSTIADRALMCSAVAYCLAFDLDGVSISDLNRLRLSAMTLELYEIIDTKSEDVHPDLAQIHELVRSEAESLFDSIWNLAGDAAFIKPEYPESGEYSLEGMLYCAAMISSNRFGMREGKWKRPNPTAPYEVERAIESIEDKTAFHNHPLAESARAIGDRKVALVYGGATKIKAYFLESARLPEVRGASTLLDQINLEDTPALFGGPQDSLPNPERRKEVRLKFKERAKLTREIDAPECVIYANGGNILAFAPVSAASELAQEIENIYTRETLVANSSAVCEAFDLIELHYGLRPASYWATDFIEDCKDD